MQRPISIIQETPILEKERKVSCVEYETVNQLAECVIYYPEKYDTLSSRVSI